MLVHALPCLRYNNVSAGGYIPHVILESLIYHVTISSTFSLEDLSELPFDYIDRIISHVRNTSVHERELGSNFAVFGIPAALLSIAYKASYLRQMESLGANGLAHVSNLKSQLSTTVTLSTHATGPFIHLIQVSELWRCACAVLLAKIAARHLDNADRAVSAAIHTALRIAHAADDELHDVAILWPLTILSFATRNIREYQILKAPLVRLARRSNSTCVEPIVAYLDRSLHCSEITAQCTTFDLLLHPHTDGLRL